MGRELTRRFGRAQLGSMMLLLAAVGLLPTTGCADDLPKATKVERMRVLGAQLEVVGDEARSTPRPGETVRVTLPTVFPSLEQSVDGVQTMLIRCTTPTQFTGGLPICQEFLDAALGQDSADVAAAIDMDTRLVCGEFPLIAERQEFQGVSLWCLDGQPRAELRIPQGIAADALFLGVVCEDGAPFLDPSEPTLFGCDGDADAEAILVNGQIPVLRDADASENHNPPIDALSLEFDSDIKGYLRGDWLPPDEDTDLTESPCERNADDERLRAVVGGRHEIMVRYRADAREELEDGSMERVEITIFATEGEMERRFTLFDELDEPVTGPLPGRDEDAPARFEQAIEWNPPRYKPQELWTATEQDTFDRIGLRPRFQNRLVRFFITVRDGRGGFAMTTRAVCLL